MRNYTYEEFKQQFADVISKALEQEGVSLEESEMMKNNKQMDALAVKYPDSVICPVMYPENAYQLYKQGMEFEDVVQSQLEMLSEARQNAPQVPELNQDYARKNLYAVAVNAEKNEEMLRSTPHRKIADLAVIPRLKMSENGSSRVTDALCAQLRITGDEALEIAEANTHEKGYTLGSMNDIMRDMMIADGISPQMADMYLQDVESPFLVLTNEEKQMGAVKMTDRKCLDEIHERLESDFYLVPSSVHEILVIPDNGDFRAEDLQDICAEVNAEIVSEEEKLSDNIYRYDGQELVIAAGPDLEISETLEKAEIPKRGR